MAKSASGIKGSSGRSRSGGLRDTRDDKQVGTLEKQYGRDFQVRSDMHIGTLLKREGFASVKQLIQSGKGKKQYTITIDVNIYLGLKNKAEEKGLSLEELLSTVAEVEQVNEDAASQKKETSKWLKRFDDFVNRPRAAGNPNADYSREAMYDR